MTVFDYALDAALILLVVLQLRTGRFGFRAVGLPLVIAGIVGAMYLRSFPTGGGDVPLIATLTAVGAAIGIASGLTARVWRDSARGVLVKASILSAALWLVGMVGRAAFQLWADGSGQQEIGRLSMQWHLTGAAPWVDGLVLMALAQVVTRVVVLTVRARLARTARPAAARYAVAA